MNKTTIKASTWLLSAAIRFSACVIAALFAISTVQTPVMAQNAIQIENSRPGNPPSEWQISGSGDASIQGFATDISVNVGGSIGFKVKTPASSYRLDIYRFGYYGGLGARKIATVSPSARLPQVQPACMTDVNVGLYDCGSWAISAQWTVPSNAVSGVYFAHLVRDDTGADSHVYFIVRNDASHSDMLFQTSDTTWVAYNDYGAGSLYGPPGLFSLPGRSRKVSYNRPFNTRAFSASSFFFLAEFPMVQWLEQNGYDVTYFTGIDAARSPNLILNHKLYLSVGHDEYWSAAQRTAVEQARDAGVNLAFFSGNEVFWKIRFENSIDGTSTSDRTLVCYKETLDNAKTDPSSIWTGAWRDPRFSPPSGGGRPENALTGTIFFVNGPSADPYSSQNNLSIMVPSAYGTLRFWRNTSIATLPSGQTATLPAGTLGYEWDIDADNGSRPEGMIRLSSATYPIVNDFLLDNGGTYGNGAPTHSLTLYRALSGALVFGAGTVQWSWGLNSNHDFLSYTPSVPAPDVRMQQATVNLFADMGAQPGSLQAGLVPATKSTDITPPVSTIFSPAAGSSIVTGTPVVISGTASDSGGTVAGVEVSTDGGLAWHSAAGGTSWTYNWTPTQVGTVHLISRAIDDSGNRETPIELSVSVNSAACPCSIWSPTAIAGADSGDPGAVVVGVRFKADYDGLITGIRFYKTSLNNGTHVGALWSSTGTLLGTATFTGETASGWQQVNFSSPVAITASTSYIASYFTPVGHYAATSGGFKTSGSDNPPLHALVDATGERNGLYNYSNGMAFPAQSYGSSNYWVDVVYFPNGSVPGAQTALAALPGSLSLNVYKQGGGTATTLSIFNQGTAALNWTGSVSAPWIKLSATSGTTPSSPTVSIDSSSLAPGTYTGTITITSAGVPGSPQVITVSATVSNLVGSSTFSDGTLQGWVASPMGLYGNWSVSNGAAVYNGGGHTQLVAGNSAWADYTLQVDMKLATLNGFPGGFRARVDPNTGAGYAVWLYPSSGIITLYKNVAWNIDSGFTTLGEANVAFDSAKFHTYAISFQGTSITVKMDGQSIITATDSASAAGVVAFDVSSQVISFTNVIVSSTSTYDATVTPSAASMNFTGMYQGARPAAQPLQVAAGGSSLEWTAVSTVPWLTVTAGGGLTPATASVTADTTGLGGGNYTGSILISALGASNTPQVVSVSLTVNVPPPSIVVSSQSLYFSSVVGQGAPTGQSVTISNGGIGSITWTASSSSPWLNVSLSAGSTPASPGVSVNPTGLTPGTYSGTISFSSPGVANSPQTIAVSYFVGNMDMAATFTSGAIEWIASPLGLADGWSVSNGVYTYSGIGHTQSCAGNANWTDYTATVGVQVPSLSNYPGGVRARVNPATGAGYAVWLYPGSNLIKLFRVPTWDIDGGPTVLVAQANLAFDTAFHDLQIDFRGNLIRVLWDGAVLITTADPNYASGYFCMDVSNRPISYQNVRIAAVQAGVALSTPVPASLNFTTLPSGQAAAQTVSISAGGATTTWGVTTSDSWLVATPASPLTPGTMSVSVNTTGLPIGVYQASLSVFAPGATNSPITIPVTLSVKSAVLAVSPESVVFFAAPGVTPNGVNLSVTNTGTGSLSWLASTGAPWMALTQTSGAAPSSTVLSVNPTGLASGEYNSDVTLTSPNTANTVTLPVRLRYGAVLFSDDFSSGTASNWTSSPLGNASGWTVVNGAYNYNGGGHTQAFAGNPAWTDYTVATGIELTGLTGHPGGLRGRVNLTTGASYGVWIYPTQGVLKLFRIGQWNIDADLTQLGQSGTIPIDLQPHRLRLSFKGSQIEVYYDDVLMIQATDSSYSSGGTALDVSDRQVVFDNVQVIGY